MASLLLLAPLFLAFEVWQLVIGERYLGIRQIARNGDPRELGLGEFTALSWLGTLVLYAGWMLALLAVSYARGYAVGLLAISVLGFVLRRNAGFKWVLVLLTFEGAVRIGLLLSLTVVAWRRW